MNGNHCVFLTLRQCPRLRIYTVVPLVLFDRMTIKDINNGVYVATFAFVGWDSVGVIGVVFLV